MKKIIEILFIIVGLIILYFILLSGVQNDLYQHILMEP